MATINKTCENCTKEFQAEIREVNRGFGRFCTRACSGAFWATRRSRTTATSVVCAYCKQDFLKTPSKMKNAKSGMYFCCREHKDLAQRLGGIVAIHPEHYGDGHAEYRNVAFRNYPSICNRCGYQRFPDVLVVHHKDRNRNNISISNLEILCPNCHGEEHFVAKDGIWRNQIK